MKRPEDYLIEECDPEIIDYIEMLEQRVDRLRIHAEEMRAARNYQCAVKLHQIANKIDELKGLLGESQ